MGDPLAPLWHPATIRMRCAAVTRAVEEGRSGHFRLDRSRLAEAARRVASITGERFPDLRIPVHSCWRHFEAGGVDRKAELDALLAGRTLADVARARIDLTVIAVVLGSAAGAQWRYAEEPGRIDALALPVQRQRRDDLLALLDRASGAAPGALPVGAPAPASDAARGYTQAEGLGIACLRGFIAGAFSSDRDDRLRVDAGALKRIDAAALRALFQAGAGNPLTGLDERAAMLRRLGEVLEDQAQRHGGPDRPSRLYDRLAPDGHPQEIMAADLVAEIARSLAPIWRSGSRVLGLGAGDVWPHAWAGAACGGEASQGRSAATAGWVPLHGPAQWLTYSLLEPFEWAGVPVVGTDALTGLPDGCNGGLLLDCGVIVPRDARDLGRPWKPADPLVVEWRALTVTLLDELAARVRDELGAAAAQLPLACILEGGTGAAARRIAQERRGGMPPLAIEGDGTLL